MNDSLLSDITVGYEPPSQSFASFLYDPNRPWFTTLAVEAMLCDPKVVLGRAMINGPIRSNARFYVDAPNPEVKKFVAQQIQRLWRCVEIPLSAGDYGRQPSEIIYRMKEGALQFDTLRYIHPSDAQAMTLGGRFVGMEVRNTEMSTDLTYVPSTPRWPKTFWAVFRRTRSRWYGESRLKGAFMPWYEKWALRGCRDQRQLFFFKCAFSGPKVYYPAGSQVTTVTDGLGNVQTIDNKLKAQAIGDAYAAGCTVAIERKANIGNGTLPDWEVVDPSVRDAPQGLLAYGGSLDNEIFEGMEIPPEVIAGGGVAGGGGISIGGGEGRDIPQQAFYSILQDTLQPIVTDFDEQCISPLVNIRFGPDEPYEIECFGLLRKEHNEQPQDMNAESAGEPTTNANEDPNNGEGEIAASDYDRAGNIIMPLDSRVRGWRSRARRESRFNFVIPRS